MILNSKSLKRLRELINEETEYRSGPQLVTLFNSLGGNDSYGQGFPSRWFYTDEKLKAINGTPEIDKCILEVFSPENFIGKVEKLDSHIEDLNRYLAFDKWKIIRESAEIKFKRLDKVVFDESCSNKRNSEDEFLKREFSDVSIAGLRLESNVSKVLEARFNEIHKCYEAGAHLSAILVAGSTMEGMFLGLAIAHPAKFNKAKASPKRDGKVLQFHEWSLATFIDVAKELELIQYDTHKFSHSLRDFRNYIHPYEQMSTGFSPREQTAKICLQVLKAVIVEISENYGRLHMK